MFQQYSQLPINEFSLQSIDISIFLKFGMVKHLKNLHNVIDFENLLPKIKICEQTIIILFLIQCLIKNLSVIAYP